MKTMKFAVRIITTALAAALAMPKAIGLTLMYYASGSAGAAQFNDGGPSDLKALNEAMEKAFKAMGENIKKVQDVAEKAREEVRMEGTLHEKTNKTLTELGETGNKLSEGMKSIQDRMLEVEQKLARKPADQDRGAKSIGQIVIESDEYKAAGKNTKPEMHPVQVGSFHKTAITEAAAATTGTLNPLVMADRNAGIILPGLRRMTVRNLLAQRTTTSNMIEFAKENVYTNNAGPQYDTTSPTPGQEGAVKNESGITFSLSQVAVTTLAHWIPASRQVLQDAPALQGYVEGRLRYGLMLEEEDEMLNSSGANGELNGLLNQATAFTGGTTNQTALDTFLKAFTQISLAEFEATGIVLHPKDWQDVMLLKDTTGRYLFSDPQAAGTPRVWGKDVVATQSMAAGQFLAGNFLLAAEVVDREDAIVRIAEQHADFFVRNMVVILAEQRLALIVYRAAAIVKGNVSYAG